MPLGFAFPLGFFFGGGFFWLKRPEIVETYISSNESWDQVTDKSQHTNAYSTKTHMEGLTFFNLWLISHCEVQRGLQQYCSFENVQPYLILERAASV